MTSADRAGGAGRAGGSGDAGSSADVGTVPAPPRLAVIAGTPQLVRAARELGVRTVLVYDAAGPVPAAAADADEVVATDLTDRALFLKALAPLHAADPFGRVLSLTEKGLLPAATATEALGLAGNPLRAVRTLKDKRLMRKLLRARGLSPVRTRAVGSAGRLAAFLREVGGPAILKPASGTGSNAVFRVDAPAGAEAAWDGFTAAGGSDAVAEEFLDGPEVSVESFSFEGRHTVVAVTDKTTLPSFVETAHAMPSTLGDARTTAAAELARAFLDAVGLREGPAHTELKMTSDGPRVIESHNRIGGDKIRELVRRTYGLDLVRLTAGVPLGLLPAPTTPPAPRGGAAIRFLTPAPGTVRRIETPPLPDSGPGAPVISVDVRVGDPVRYVRSSDDRAGYVLAQGADATDAAARCARISGQVRIETEE